MHEISHPFLHVLSQFCAQASLQLFPQPEQEDDLAEFSQLLLQFSLHTLLQLELQSEQDEDFAESTQLSEQLSLQEVLQPLPHPFLAVPTQLLLQSPQPLCAVPVQLLLQPSTSSSLLQEFNKLGAKTTNPKNGIVFFMAILKKLRRVISIFISISNQNQ